VSTYPPFSCWTEAGVDQYRRVLAAPPAVGPATPLGLYVHIPFCVERCHYCYYLSHDDRHFDVDAYLAALQRELTLYGELPGLAGRRPQFVYFGGGTPSILSTPRVRRLLDAVQAAFPWDAVREVTFECAPRSTSEDKLRALRECGVTRVSLGVQQMDDAVLRENGRVHLIEDIERAYAAIRRVGFDVVNLDLMVGLVAETDETFHQSLQRVIALAPDTVTIYQLEIPLNTPLYRSLHDGTLGHELASWEVKRARLQAAFARLETEGYVLRSAYTAVRDPQRHSFVYQDEQYRGADLLGIGVASFSHLGGVNQQNQASLRRYLECLARGELPLGRAYALDRDERLVREFVLQLKLGRVDRHELSARFGADIVQRFAEPLAALERERLLEVSDQAVTLTPAGLLQVDRLLQAFYLPAHRDVRYS
jgi:oxygen-independent coproporphyrinogen-3 oxidase